MGQLAQGARRPGVDLEMRRQLPARRGWEFFEPTKFAQQGTNAKQEVRFECDEKQTGGCGGWRFCINSAKG